MASPSKSTMESLPKQFVDSMRVLFNILDEKKTGQISIQDIQMRWQDGKVNDLPPGVLSALMKVTPANGFINFDRFVAGLQIALLRQRHSATDSRQRQPDLIADHKLTHQATATVHPNNAIAKHHSNSLTDVHSAANQEPMGQRPAYERPAHSTRTASNENSRPTHVENTRPRHENNRPGHTDNAGTVQNTHQGSAEKPWYQPQSTSKQQRPASAQKQPWLHDDQSSVPVQSAMRNSMAPPPLPRRGGGSREEQKFSNSVYSQPVSHSSQQPVQKVYTDSSQMHAASQQQHHSSGSQTQHTGTNQSHPGVNSQKKHHVERLRLASAPHSDMYNGHRGPGHMYGRRAITPTNLSSGIVLTGEPRKYQTTNEVTTSRPTGNDPNQLVNDANRPSLRESRLAASAFKRTGGTQDDSVTTAVHRRVGGRKQRDQPRRHTLASGVDYTVIQRFKQLEDERESFLVGLDHAQRVTNWYQQQINSVNEKLQQAQNNNDFPGEANHERVNLQAARINEINSQLQGLMDGTHKGLPLKLKSPTHPTISKDEYDALDNRITMMKAQNKLLTKEVNQKTDRMSQLEREKASLIRELFDARTQQQNQRSGHDDTTFM